MLRTSRLAVLALSLCALAACTPYGYVKPGVTEEEYAQDSLDCAQIARQQAFRDYGVDLSRYRRPVPGQRGTYYSVYPEDRMSQGELEFRYRRICMQSKGYELAPLDEGDSGAKPADGPVDGPVDDPEAVPQ